MPSRLQAGKNGAIAPLTEQGRVGFQFRAQDGRTVGPARWAPTPERWLGPFLQARDDWAEHLDSGAPMPGKLAKVKAPVLAAPPVTAGVRDL